MCKSGVSRLWFSFCQWLVSGWRRTSVGREATTRQEQSEEDRRRCAQCWGFVQTILARAKTNYSGIRQELDEFEDRLRSDYRRCDSYRVLTESFKYDLRMAREHNTLPPNIVNDLSGQFNRLF